MSHSSKRGFIHSVKVPRLYKSASIIVKKVVEEGGSLKDLVYSSNHQNIKGIYALVVKTIQHNQELDRLLKKSKLLEKESRLQPWLAKVLITELLFGKRELKGESKPVQTVLTYKKQIEKFLTNKRNISKKTEKNHCVKKPRYVRVNTLHHTPDEIIKIFRNDGWIFTPPPNDYSEFLKLIANLNEDCFTRDFHIKELLVFSANVQFYENELYQKGQILLQDKASCLPGFLLKPKTNSVVLDMCAAPGMKTTHLSAIMKNTGKIYATEINVDRYEVLCDLIKRTGCSNVTAVHTDALKLNSTEDCDMTWCNDVEYILVDPSCSGSGIVERMNIFENEKQDFRRLKKLCGFQYKLLLHALTSFPKAKRVVYSTCSTQTIENEKVVEDVLMKLKEMYDDSGAGEEQKNRLKRPYRLTEPLKDTWIRRGSEEFEHGKNYIFSDPKVDLTNGFFIAVFEREKSDIWDEDDQNVTVLNKKKKRKNQEENLQT